MQVKMQVKKGTEGVKISGSPLRGSSHTWTLRLYLFEKADRAGFECSAKPPYAVEKFCAIFIVFFALFWWYNRGRI